MRRTVAARINDPRAPDQITHPLADIIRFQLLMIGAGYEGGNNASLLRGDPMFKMALDLSPSDRELCSQSTISRLENLPDARTLLRMGRAMVDLYCESFFRNPSVAAREKIGYPSAILRRTGGVALDAVGIGSTRLQLQFDFKPDFVFPGDVEVVFVDETRAPAKLKLAKRNIRRPATELPGTKIGGAQVEQKEVNALPARRDLEYAVQFPQRRARRRLHSPPDHWADPLKPDLELQNFCAVVRRVVRRGRFRM
jgi:hypothetical protein